MFICLLFWVQTLLSSSVFVLHTHTKIKRWKKKVDIELTAVNMEEKCQYGREIWRPNALCYNNSPWKVAGNYWSFIEIPEIWKLIHVLIAMSWQ